LFSTTTYSNAKMCPAAPPRPPHPKPIDLHAALVFIISSNSR
jgi:hypothetical protein